jgi:C-terminal processing protease CtpA/Prc
MKLQSFLSTSTKTQYYFLSLLLTFIWSCSDDLPDEVGEEVIEEELVINNEIIDFIWKGMNENYYWQADVADLRDEKDDNFENYASFLNSFSDPEEFYEALIYQPGVSDRFSFYINDYQDFEESRRGVGDSFGFDFGLLLLCEDCTEVIGYIKYVVPDSPASDAGLKRGDLFSVFNGVELDVNNFRVVNAFFTDEQISLGLATIENGAIQPEEDEKLLVIRPVIENPIFSAQVFEDGQGRKVGYLMYKRFRFTFHEELNEVFGFFKSQGIQDLILDMRYNPGGTTITAALLASMIYGEAGPNEIFSKVIHNDKIADENFAYPFFNDVFLYDKDTGEYLSEIPMNRLSGLSRLFVITTEETASSSELVMNGLSPFMDIVQVGTTTFGKNVGSFTLYDSPGFGPQDVNPNHTVAIQPITFKIFNKNDESDYTQGFAPDYEVIEFVSEMKDFGDPEEPLLQATLGIISGDMSKYNELKSKEVFRKELFKTYDFKPFETDMYLLPDELKDRKY